MRIFKSHPLIKLVNSYLIDSCQPSNLSYLWNFCSLSLKLSSLNSLLARVSESIEWLFDSPPKPHIFECLPLQSGVSRSSKGGPSVDEIDSILEDSINIRYDALLTNEPSNLEFDKLPSRLPFYEDKFSRFKHTKAAQIEDKPSNETALLELSNIDLDLYDPSFLDKAIIYLNGLLNNTFFSHHQLVFIAGTLLGALLVKQIKKFYNSEASGKASYIESWIPFMQQDLIVNPVWTYTPSDNVPQHLRPQLNRFWYTLREGSPVIYRRVTADRNLYYQVLNYRIAYLEWTAVYFNTRDLIRSQSLTPTDAIRRMNNLAFRLAAMNTATDGLDPRYRDFFHLFHSPLLSMTMDIQITLRHSDLNRWVLTPEFEGDLIRQLSPLNTFFYIIMDEPVNSSDSSINPLATSDQLTNTFRLGTRSYRLVNIIPDQLTVNDIRVIRARSDGTFDWFVLIE